MFEWIAVGVGVYAVFQVIAAVQAAQKRKWNERFDLQFWQADHGDVPDDVFVKTEVHFPSMLMRSTYASMGLDTFRLHNVRRKGDGTWECRMTAESLEMEKLAAKDSPLPEEFETSGEWTAIEAAPLETAYQRFVHAQDVPVADIATRWREEEKKKHERERMRRRVG